MPAALTPNIQSIPIEARSNVSPNTPKPGHIIGNGGDKLGPRIIPSWKLSQEPIKRNQNY